MILKPSKHWRIEDKDVKDKNRFSNLVQDMETCCICGAKATDLHEVFNGANRRNSKRYGLVLPLCRLHHQTIHSNHEIDLQIKKSVQSIVIEKIGEDEYRKVFRKYYV